MLLSENKYDDDDDDDDTVLRCPSLFSRTFLACDVCHFYMQQQRRSNFGLKDRHPFLIQYSQSMIAKCPSTLY